MDQQTRRARQMQKYFLQLTCKYIVVHWCTECSVTHRHFTLQNFPFPTGSPSYACVFVVQRRLSLSLSLTIEMIQGSELRWLVLLAVLVCVSTLKCFVVIARSYSVLRLAISGLKTTQSECNGLT